MQSAATKKDGWRPGLECAGNCVGRVVLESGTDVETTERTRAELAHVAILAKVSVLCALVELFDFQWSNFSIFLRSPPTHARGLATGAWSGGAWQTVGRAATQLGAGL